MNADGNAEQQTILEGHFDAAAITEADEIVILNRRILRGVPPYIRTLVESDPSLNLVSEMTWAEAIMDSSVTQLRELVRDEVLGSPRFFVETVQSPYEKAGELREKPTWQPPRIILHTAEGAEVFTGSTRHAPVRDIEIRNTSYLSSIYVRKLGHANVDNAKDLIGANGQGTKYAIIGLSATVADRVRIAEHFLSGKSGRGELPEVEKQALANAVNEMKNLTAGSEQEEPYITFQARESENGEYYRYYFFRVPLENGEYDVQMIRVTVATVPPDDEDQVIVTLHNADPFQVSMLEKLPETILWMNPGYPDDNSLVPPDREREAVKIETAEVNLWHKNEQYSIEVELLDGSFAPGIYLDGQLLRPKDGTQVALGYNIKTLGDSRLRNLFIRSHESVELTGPVEELVHKAVLERRSTADWRTILRCANGKTSEEIKKGRYAEFQMDQNYVPEALAETVRTAFQEEFGEAVYLGNPDLAAVAAVIGIDIPSGAPVIRVFEELLKRAKIRNIEDTITDRFYGMFHIRGERYSVTPLDILPGTNEAPAGKRFERLMAALPESVLAGIYEAKTSHDGEHFVLTLQLDDDAVELSASAAETAEHPSLIPVFPVMAELQRTGNTVVLISGIRKCSVADVGHRTHLGTTSVTYGYEKAAIRISGTLEEVLAFKKTVASMRPDLETAATDNLLEALEENKLTPEHIEALRQMVLMKQQFSLATDTAAVREEGGFRHSVSNMFYSEQPTRSETDERPKGPDVLFFCSGFENDPPDFYMHGAYDESTMNSRGVSHKNTSRAFVPASVPWGMYNPDARPYRSRRTLRFDGILETAVLLVPGNGYIGLPVDGTEFEIAAIDVPRKPGIYPPIVQYDEINNLYILYFKEADEGGDSALMTELPAYTRIYLKRKAPSFTSDRQMLLEKYPQYYKKLLETPLRIADLDSEAQEFFSILTSVRPPLNVEMKQIAVTAFWDRRRAYTKSGTHHASIAEAVASGIGSCPDGEVPLTHLFRLAGIPARSASGYADYAKIGSLRGSSGHLVTQYISDDGNWTKRDPPNSRVTLDFVRMMYQQITRGHAPYVREAYALNTEPDIEGLSGLPEPLRKFIDRMPYRGVNLNAELSNVLMSVHNGELVSILDLITGIQSLQSLIGKEKHPMPNAADIAKELAAMQTRLRTEAVTMTNDEINALYVRMVTGIMRASGVEGLLKL